MLIGNSITAAIDKRIYIYSVLLITFSVEGLRLKTQFYVKHNTIVINRLNVNLETTELRSLKVYTRFIFEVELHRCIRHLWIKSSKKFKSGSSTLHWMLSSRSRFSYWISDLSNSISLLAHCFNLFDTTAAICLWYYVVHEHSDVQHGIATQHRPIELEFFYTHKDHCYCRGLRNREIQQDFNL